MDKIILHVDLDAFFASVEELDNPKLKGRPVIVGGKSKRGVVSTCNYKAREYGIHSAMPIFKAKKLCPNGVYIYPRGKRYSEVSHEVFNILHSITDKIEKVSIDEAYIDISNLYQSPEYVVKLIKKRIKNEVGITLSVGISYNKFLAKLASDWNKPNGVKKIDKSMVPEILEPLELREIHGLGIKSVNKLNRLGIFTVKDLLAYSQSNLESFLGKLGIEIYYRIRGIDNRELKYNYERKSYGHEITLPEDIIDRQKLWGYLVEMLEKIYKYLEKDNKVGKTLTIKVKFKDFTTITRSKTSSHNVFEYEAFQLIMRKIFDKIDFKSSVRLIGVTISNLDDRKNQQLSIF